MQNLYNLEPKDVFKFFIDISKIPHGSGNTKLICDYLENFAVERNLTYYRDELNNIIIKKNGTKGYENAPVVILQGHTDMVCEKAPDCDKDMEKEGLELKVDGDFVYAEKTTLGGDDGIAVAMCLALLDSETIPHPPLEAVLTVDEEIGMLGATGLDMSNLSGKLMFNIDSEEEGIFTVSCAGGNVTTSSFELKRENFDGTPLEIEVTGLAGGHSGIEIDKKRANSNLLMGRILSRILKETDIRIVSVNGGLKDNAIPVCTKAHIIAENPEKVKVIADNMQKIFLNEYSITDSKININVTAGEKEEPFDKESTDKITELLNCMPNGIMEMSADVEGLVQTSLNLGIVKTVDNKFSMSFCVRSSIESQKEMVTDKIASLTRLAGGETAVTGDYPGWQYKKDSFTRDILAKTYKELFGKDAEIVAIHAGVECGIFAGRIKDFDGISFGPDLKDIHTYRERMSISSVERTWKLLTSVLQQIK